MTEENIDVLTPPEAPQTVAELLPFLPLDYEYAKQWGLVFSQELADRLAAVQTENPTQHVAKPVQLTDGRYYLNGDLLTEVPNGLYGLGFQQLDAARFVEIAVVPVSDALALLPAQNETDM